MKKAASAMLILLILFGSALAVSEEEEAFFMCEEALFQYAESITYRDLGVKKGEKLPVYSAPYEDAWRGANGKAAVSTAEPFELLAWNLQHTWLMVEYTTSAPERRIGWIRADTDRLSIDAEMNPFSRCLLRTIKSTRLTDDPRGRQRQIASLNAGETLIGLWRITDSPWIYAETTIDGKTVWAFVPAEDVEPVPMYHLEGDTLVVHEGVSRLGGYFDEDGFLPGPGELILFMMDLEESALRFSSLRLPRSLRSINWLEPCRLKELTLPEGLVSIAPDAFYASSIGTLRLPSTCEDLSNLLDSEYLSVGSFEVADGHPLYCAVDGVLFSKDRKTLIRYPCGSSRTHYDVPAGTLAIADNAFSDDRMELALVTVSLPLGLKSIGEYAFSDCGRLISLTVPLTVTELAPNAFCYCVSLERLSLPPGFSAELSSWVDPADFTHYSGDNGTTGTEKDGNSFSRDWWYAWVDGEGGAAAFYRDASDREAAGTLKNGAVMTIETITGGRAGRREYIGLDELSAARYEWTWISLGDLLPVTGQVLFEPASAVLADGAEPLDGVYSPDREIPWQPTDWGEPWAGDRVWFGRETDLGSEEIECFLGDVILYRKHTGDQRLLGILAAERSGETVQLYDGPFGDPVAHYYTGEQAEQLDLQDGWALVRTAGHTGWIPQEYFRTVEQEP